MAKKSFTAKQTSFEPVIVDLDGKEYQLIDHISQSVLDEVEGTKSASTVLALLLGTDESEFKNADVRVLAEIAAYLIEEVKKQFEGKMKNPMEQPVKG